ncbi:amidohydrolase [Pedobacter sp. MC2016-15]|uniref:amidohydrolase n=1 Tax=Pedobacter sp. MC2016-15 TaxID=2994473 RepID=UPI0022471D38|nr:amidohydrolase [Pedobacter sp. MC2016-15]MCX2479088.1 amidohydrolase [Pedobacter sp. MC2016-15]
MKRFRMTGRALLAITACTLLYSCAGKPHQSAESVVTGKIWTGDPEHPWAEAMAISGDSILAVGSMGDVKAWIGKSTKTTTTDTANLIVPGFIDSHTHFVDGGLKLSSVQLRDAKSPQEFIRRIADFAKTQKKGVWITGGSWDHQNWGGELPEKSWIDSVTKDNPVWINRLDGHMLLANSLALKLAGVDDNIKDVKGGEIIRKNGKVTGLLKDNAKEIVNKVNPLPDNEQKDAALQAAMQYVASNGVTSIVSLTGTGYGSYIDVYKRAREQKKLNTRIYAVAELENWAALAKDIKENGRGDKWVKLGGVKGFVDGSLGSHTAAFMHPFTDAPADSGFFVISEDLLYKRLKSADSAGLQLFVHAIGDRSINALLNVYERIEKADGPRDRRMRMEHAQHIFPADLPRFAKLGVIASVQPYHAIDDGRWAEKVIGHERAKTTYAFRSLLDAGAKITLGSDWFVAPASPLLGIYAAVTRRTLDDKNPQGWIPEQKITVEEALKGYTIQAAYATFEEQHKGSLKTGKLADYVILEKDITKIDPVTIKDVKILSTVVGGKEVYKNPVKN